MTYCIKKYNTNVTAKSRQKPTQNELVEESSWCLNQLLTRHEKRPTCVRWTRRFFSFSRCWTFLIFSSIFRLIFFFIFSIGGLLTLFLENRKYMLLRYVYYILKCQNIENNPNSFANLIIHCKHFQITDLNASLKGFGFNVPMFVFDLGLRVRIWGGGGECHVTLFFINQILGLI